MNEGVHVRGSGDSDESDDDALRMTIYRKLKENSKQVHHNMYQATADASHSIAPSLQQLRIEDELPSMNEVHFDCQEEPKYLKRESSSGYCMEAEENYLDGK